jgi:hypothetical protein
MDLSLLPDFLLKNIFWQNKLIDYQLHSTKLNPFPIKKGIQSCEKSQQNFPPASFFNNSFYK